MSNNGSSNPDISEEPNEGNTQEEMSEEPNEGNTQEVISEEPNGGNTQEEISEEPNGGNTQEEIREEPNGGITQEEISEEPNGGNTQEEISEEPNEGNTQEEISEEPSGGKTQEEISEIDDEGSNTPEISEEQNEGNTQETSEEDNGAIKITATEDQVKIIFEELKKDGVSKIILTGEAGTGKTWMATKICESAVKENHDEPIWISLDKKHDKKSVSDTIARQFALPTSTDEREEDGENVKKEKNVKSLVEKMEEKLEVASKAKKFLLVVLDGQVEVMTEKDEEIEIEYVMEVLGLKGDRGQKYKGKFKVLITRKKSEDGDSSNESMKYELKPLSRDEALNLLREKVVRRVSSSPHFEDISATIQQSSKPAEILMLAGTLNNFAKDISGEFKHAMEAAANGLQQLLRYTYDKEPGNCMIDCFWHSWHFLRKHGGVHYNELITNWITEGCLNPTNQIEKAYKEGHRVLMTLIDCYMLKMQEDNIIVMERATLKMNEYCRRAYTETADPGLASVLKDHEPKVLEGITPADGMMKTLCGDKKEKLISSLLIDGGRLCREVHETFFGDKQNLNLLAIFSPRLKSPDELSVAKMENLRVLMLRGSYLLENVNNIAKLKALAVLEISGSTYLGTIPDDFFHEVSQLRSLHLSGASIESLPSSFSELTELRRLILRQCSSLQQLPKLDKLIKLEVIDLSGCKNLKKIQEKSFNSLEKLQVINFSQTKIEKLPIVKTLRNLRILLLKGCRELSGMRMLKQVSSLKILDLSGADNIKEIMYDCFEDAEGLTELDLSETKIQFLPSDIGNLQKLRLKGCSLLKNLPELEGHSRLEELELSGCESLVKLPDLTALQNLKIIGLESCINLEILPDLKSLSKLEKLDLRGTKLWSEDVVKSLSDLTRLQILTSN
ncbi:hypothetical protein REPUB_Repub08aG0233300 [Reevesia pubescens]